MAGLTGPRVDVVIGGVQKGGTTALADTLSRHPALALAQGKEAHWFDSNGIFAGGTPDPAPYHARFAHARPGQRLIDATPSYLWWPPAAGRIHAYNPAMQWIVLLRDPATRAYSHWNMHRTQGHESLTFEAALDADLAALRAHPDVYAFHRSYLSRGFYAQQLERAFALFGRERILVLRSDDYRKHPERVAAEAIRFLGLDPSRGPLDVRYPHEGSYAGRLEPATRANLVAFYADEIARLEALLGWDLSDWRRV